MAWIAAAAPEVCDAHAAAGDCVYTCTGGGAAPVLSALLVLFELPPLDFFTFFTFFSFFSLLSFFFAITR